MALGYVCFRAFWKNGRLDRWLELRQR